ncbi:hypothetical protein E2320_008023 [Naja naja]|nr:hypothetical protein E2320_008023 [Naja naja]
MIIVGSLFLVKPLTHQFSTPDICLLVEASDHGNPPLAAKTSVTVQIQAMNPYIPLFTLATYNFDVSENASVGENMFTFSVNDQGRNHQGTNVVYSIIGGNNDNEFYVKKFVFGPEYSDQTIGNLALRDTLDQEKCSSYKLLILAFDHSVAHLNSTATVSITILDVNDNPPVFTSLEYHVHVREDFPVGNYITSVSAYDYDAGTNADSLSGNICTKQVLDFEHHSKYCFIAQAKDKSNCTATVTVQVNVEGLDEFDPVFNQDEYFFYFPEKNEAGQLIGDVKASDCDGGLDGVIYYTLLEQSSFFSVNCSSGSFYLARSFHKKRSSMKKKVTLLNF